MEGKSEPKKRWGKNTDSENLPQNDDYRVGENYTTTSNQVEQIDKILTPKSTEESENSDKNQHPIGRVIDLSAQNAGVSPMTYSKGRHIIDNASEEMKDKLRKGSVKIDKVYRQLQKQQKRQELVNAAASVLQSPTDNVKLYRETLLKSQRNSFLTIRLIYCLQILFMDYNIYRYTII